MYQACNIGEENKGPSVDCSIANNFCIMKCFWTFATDWILLVPVFVVTSFNLKHENFEIQNIMMLVTLIRLLPEASITYFHFMSVRHSASSSNKSSAVAKEHDADLFQHFKKENRNNNLKINANENNLLMNRLQKKFVKQMDRAHKICSWI